MKIAIITLPLHTNYGGILQAYAVQKVLCDMGHDVETISLAKREKTTSEQLALFVKSFIAILIGKNKFSDIYWPFNTRNKNKKLRADSLSFYSKYLKMSRPLITSSDIREYCKQEHFNTFIVGSDQVWRPNYGDGIGKFFLDFLDGNSVKRISLAASFGTSEWEFTSEQTERCAALAKKFDAISVREEVGVELCRKYLNVDATCIIDPTMLLTPADYKELVCKCQQTHNVKNKIFCYVLDKSKEKDNAISEVLQFLNMDVDSIEAEPKLPPYASIKTALKDPPKPVEQWIRSFEEACFVITDSFHGTVFSILHHRPFIVLANKGRGVSRIETLLSTFGLTERLITKDKQINDVNWLLNGIDWGRVDNLLNEKRNEANQFITNALE